MNSVQSTDSSKARGFSPSALWPVRLLGRRPGLKEINVVCWGLFVAFLLVPSCVVFVLQARHGSESIQRHSDFVFYYGVGTLADHVAPAKIYDPALQVQTFRAINPRPRGTYGDCPYPPLVPYWFSLFALLPFTVAYFLWMACSLFLYCAAVVIVSWFAFHGDKLKTALFVCFALAFYPFSASTLVNGQISVLAILAVGFALYEENKGHPFYSGAALALLTYKPTLLVVILPMLLLTRRFKALGGFCYGVLVVMLCETSMGGPAVWPAYFKLLQYHSKLSGVTGQAAIRLPMYLDFASLTHLLPGGRSPAVLALTAVFSVVVGASLVLLLLKSAKGGRSVLWLAWAATLTWTLLLNIYVPIYDSVLAVLAIALTLGALSELKWRVANEWITLLAVVTFVVSWKTVSFAEVHHVQLLSIALFLLGAAQLWLLYRAIAKEKTEAAILAA